MGSNFWRWTVSDKTLIEKWNQLNLQKVVISRELKQWEKKSLRLDKRLEKSIKKGLLQQIKQLEINREKIKNQIMQIEKTIQSIDRQIKNTEEEYNYMNRLNKLE